MEGTQGPQSLDIQLIRSWVSVRASATPPRGGAGPQRTSYSTMHVRGSDQVLMSFAR